MRRASRRSFLKGGLAAAGALVVPWELLGSGRASAAALPYSPDYGPLGDVIDSNTGLPLLRLPAGFTYKSYGWTNDPLTDGIPTPGRHDGMAVCGQDRDRIVLVRNHERTGAGGSFGPARITYDPVAVGGTTSLAFDPRSGNFLSAWASLAGTLTNCAGGPTPWGSWLSCEETTQGPRTDSRYTRQHGWVFEVPAFGSADPQPITAMGAFAHEATATDPVTSIVYLTEDGGDSSGFYRYVPGVKQRLAHGGALQMLKIAGKPRMDLRGAAANGTTWDVEWVSVPDPTKVYLDGTTSGHGVFRQGYAAGGARFRRGEGCWYGNAVIWWISTNGGRVGKGQVYKYDPRAETLTMVYESPGAGTLDNPDNCAWSPRGSLILCEDGANPVRRMHGLTSDGAIFPFCENNMDLTATPAKGFRGNFKGAEFAGATFHDEWLFVNVQTPGVTFAITGPWDNGAL